MEENIIPKHQVLFADKVFNRRTGLHFIVEWVQRNAKTGEVVEVALLEFETKIRHRRSGVEYVELINSGALEYWQPIDAGR